MKHSYAGKAAMIALLAMLGLGGNAQAQIVVHGDVYGAGKGSASDKSIAIVKGNSNVDIATGNVYGNVYGGGELSSVGTYTTTGSGDNEDYTACENGKSTVTIRGGQIGKVEYDKKGVKVGGYVFGGGKGLSGHPYRLFAFVDSARVNIQNGAFVTASVFGGAENGHVFTNTYVEMTGGTVGQEISPAEYMTEDPTTGISHWLYFGNVYGGGRGVEAIREYHVTATSEEIAANGWVLNTDYHVGTAINIDGEEVLGANILYKKGSTQDSTLPYYSMTAGRVRGNTKVMINHGHVVRNVYGGGSLATVGMDDDLATNGNATVTIKGDAIIGLPDADIFSDNSNLNTFKLIGDTYGVDADLPDAVKSTDEGITKVKDLLFYLWAGHNSGRVFGSGRGEPGDAGSQFTRMAHVKNSEVNIEGSAQVRGSVFGGGENGHVSQNTEVNIKGGQIGIPVRGTESRTWVVDNFSGRKGKNGVLLAHDTLTWGEHWENETGVGPTIFRGNVYGGGRGVDTIVNHIANRQLSSTSGRVYGNTTVTVSGGTVCHAVFGGGSLASVGDTIASISGGPVDALGNSISGQYEFRRYKEVDVTDGYDGYAITDTAGITEQRAYAVGDPITGTGLATVIICGGQIGENGINEGRVYGSGRGVAGDRTHFAEQTNMAFTHNTKVILRGANGTDTENTVSGSTGADVRGAVFGGGANGHVMQNSQVVMTGGTVGVRLPLWQRKVDDATGYGVRVYRGNVYGGGRGVDPIANVNHLSITAGRVYGNTSVQISGGKVFHSVFGGGSLASVGTFVLEDHNGCTAEQMAAGTCTPDYEHHYIRGTGNASVTISDGAWIGHDATDLASVDYTTLTTEELALVKSSFSLSDGDWTAMSAAEKNHLLVELNYKYLGSNSGMVFGSGRGVAALEDGTFDRDYAEAAFTNNTFVTIKDGTNKPVICGSVFGGGENGHVKHNTLVTIEGGRIGGVPLHNSSFHPYYSDPEHDASYHFTTDQTLSIDRLYEDDEDMLGVGPSVYRGNVYGGGRGVDHKGDNAVEGFSSTAGRVYGNTKVYVTGGFIYHNVYGGGSIASVGTYDLHESGAYEGAPKKCNTITSYAAMDESSPKTWNTGRTLVTVSGGIVGTTGHNEGSVFGGGRGIAGSRTDQVTHLAFCNISNVAIVPGAQVMGSVFGGGANGHVLDSTLVHITGGIVGHPLDGEDTLTTRYGYAPRTVFRGNVYGGGRGVDPVTGGNLSTTAGRVYGNTHVLMEGGWVRHSVFGGGSMASVGFYESIGDAPAGLQWEDATGVIHKLSEASSKTDREEIKSNSGRAWVEITGGIVGSQAAGAVYTDGGSYETAMKTGQGGEGRNNGRVFGSCRGTAGAGYDKLAYVNITRVIIGTAGSATGPQIMGCVFGSGENGHVLDSTLVQMRSGDIGSKKVYDWKRTYIGNLYGGGRGIDFTHTNELSATAGWVHTSTRVEMTGGHVWHNVYGGGSLASVGDWTAAPTYKNTHDTVGTADQVGGRIGLTTVIVTGGKVGVDGLYDGNVFGSGRGRAGANTDTIFHLCNNECVYSPAVDQAPGTAITIGGTSYGTRTLKKKSDPAGDSLYLAVIRNHANTADSIYYVLNSIANDDVKTVYHDFSDRTSVLNTKVVIDYATINESNRIHGSVYGSGDNGHVLNTTYVDIRAGQIGTKLSFADDAARAGYLDNYSTADRATIDENIAPDGLVLSGGSVYGSGRGLDLTGVSSYSATAGRTFGHTQVSVTGGTIMRNVYGGGNMASVGTRADDGLGTGTTLVNVTGGTLGSASTNALYGGNVYGSSRGRANDPAVPTLDFADMAYAHSTLVNIGTEAGTATPTVYGNVYGGGEAGHVDYGGTTVNIKSGTVKGNVFGGGMGASTSPTAGIVDGNTQVNIGLEAQSSNNVVIGTSGDENTGNVFGGNDAGSSPLGVMRVDVWHTGHAVANTCPTISTLTDSDKADLLNETNASNSANYALLGVYGGGNQASVLTGDPSVDAPDWTGAALTKLNKKYITQRLDPGHNGNPAWPGDTSRLSKVVIHYCDENTVKYVYGGGRAANTLQNDVTIEGGRVYMAFAGGDGHTLDPITDNPLPANVKKSTVANMTSTGNVAVSVQGGIVYDVFGGSNTSGIIEGKTSIDLTPKSPCDLINSETFGGGNEAVGNGGTIDLVCGTKFMNFYGGARNADINGPITLNVHGGEYDTIFGGNKAGGVIHGDVTVNFYGGQTKCLFGGSNKGGNILGTINVNVNVQPDPSCPDVRLDYVYGGGKDAFYRPSDTTITSPVVRIVNDVLTTDVFGAGLGQTATVYANPKVIIGCDTNTSGTPRTVTVLGNVYGGGSAAPVYGNPTVQTLSKDGVCNTTLNGNVYGAGYGSTAVTTTVGAVDGDHPKGHGNGKTTVDIRGNRTTVEGNVYGGGNAGILNGSTDVIIGDYE